MIKQVVANLRMTPLVEAVTIPFVHTFLDEESEIFAPNELIEGAAKNMFDELVRVESALRPLRSS
jgi:hypothetical protein